MPVALRAEFQAFSVGDAARIAGVFGRDKVRIYSSIFDAVRQGFVVGLIVQFLYPHKKGPRSKVLLMNALAVIRSAILYGIAAYTLDRLLANWW